MKAITTEQDIKDYVEKRRNKGYWDEVIANEIDEMFKNDKISSDLYYFAMEYIDDEMQEQIDTQEQYDMEKEEIE